MTPRAATLRRDLCCITADGVTYSFMVGVGETYVAAFALALGLGEVIAGLVTTLPILVGALLQLVTPRGVKALGSNRRWVLLCATVQSLSLLPLGAAALVGAIPAWALLLFVSLYWAGNLGAGPAWNTWMTAIVPRGIRAHYFGRRTRLCQLGTLAGILVGGMALAVGEREAMLPAIFVVCFGLAAFSRGLSTAFLSAQSEPRRDVRGHRDVSPVELLVRVRHGPDARLLSYMLAIQVAVQVSGAYFTPYMLGELAFSKADYMWLISANFLAKSVAAPLMGLLAKRIGALRLLRIGGLGIIPLAGLWILFDDFWPLLAVQLLSGAMWSAYELATFLLMLETIREEERTSVLTIFNVANAAAIAGGSLGGGAILAGLGAGATGYVVIFGLSTCLRVLAALLLWRVRTDAVHPVPLATGPVAVRPNLGSIERPYLGSLPPEAVDGEGESGAVPGGKEAPR